MSLFRKKKDAIITDDSTSSANVPLSNELVYETLRTWKNNTRDFDMTSGSEKQDKNAQSGHVSLKPEFYDLLQVKTSVEFSQDFTVYNTIGYAREMFERSGVSPYDFSFVSNHSMPIILISAFMDDICRNILEAVIEDNDGEDLEPLKLLDDVLEWCQYAGALAAVTYNINPDFSIFKSPYYSVTRGKGLDEIIRLLEVKTMNTDERFAVYEECFPRIREKLLEPLFGCKTEKILIAQIAQSILNAYITSVSMELNSDFLS